MRKKIKSYKEFEQRTIEKFLWFPMQLGDDWRWLEKVKIRQEYRVPDCVSYLYGKRPYWNDLKFVENETEHVDGYQEYIKKTMPPCKPPRKP